MKKTITIITVIIALTFSLPATAQTLLARWTFPTGTPADSLADGGIPANLAKSIHTDAAQATGWDNGAMTKCWMIELSTLNYENLKISSKQQSGGNNPGPKDFIVQYRIGSGGTWTDVPNAVIITANNWTSGVLDSLPMPDSCENRASLFLRWLMTTNDNTAGGTVAASGIDKIEDIYITGKAWATEKPP
jgi:hypothetical protein